MTGRVEGAVALIAGTGRGDVIRLVQETQALSALPWRAGWMQRARAWRLCGRAREGR
jgi:hypothetical protein